MSLLGSADDPRPETTEPLRADASAELLGRLEQALQENRLLAGLYWQAEKQRDTLLALYVAALRLHSTLDRSEQLVALQEVLANLVGCEEAGVYEIEAGELKPIALFGADAETATVSLGHGPIAGAIKSQTVYIAPVREAANRVTACVPLLLQGRPTGVIVLFSLLGQKSTLDENDRELLEMLSTQAALALSVSAPRNE